MIVTDKNWKLHLEQAAQQGTTTELNLTPECTDDIWTLYNILKPGDQVQTVTMRKVLQESNSGEVVDSQRMKLVLRISVEKIDADLAAEGGGVLRVNGKTVTENRHVRLGSYHTLDLAADRWLVLRKDRWDGLELELLDQAVRSLGRVEIGVILLGEHGVAWLGILLPTAASSSGAGGAAQPSASEAAPMRVLRRIEVKLGNKRFGAADKQLDKYYAQVIDAALEVIRFDALKAIILASAEEALRDQFYHRLLQQAQQLSDSEAEAHSKPRSKGHPAEQPRAHLSILQHKNKLLKLGLRKAIPAALTEILREPRIASLLADTKAAKETKLMHTFCKMAASSADQQAELTSFGLDPIVKAAEQGAVKHLLLSDQLARSTQIAERKKYSQLIQTVRDNGGEVTIFTSGLDPEHILSQHSGVAAILKFPVSPE